MHRPTAIFAGLALAILLHGCAVPAPGPGPFGRIVDDVKEGLRKTGEDLRTVAREVRDSTDPDKAHNAPLRVLLVGDGIVKGGRDGVLNDLERSLRKRGFEVMGEDEPGAAAPLNRYRQGNGSPTLRGALDETAFSLPPGSFGVLMASMNGYRINRKGSLSHGRISGTAKFMVKFHFSADPVHLPEKDMGRGYWERRVVVERQITGRQLSFLEDQILQDLNARDDAIVRTPQLRAAYLSEVLAEAFDRVAGTMPRPQSH